MAREPIESVAAGTFGAPAANAGGALDVIAIQQPDGTLRCTPWHVVFDSLSQPSPEQVSVGINGVSIDVQLHVSARFEPAVFAGAASGNKSTPPDSVLHQLSSSGVLREGCNELRYSLSSDHERCVRAFIYVWRSTSPIVVCDIDGTVTLNDLAGQAAMIVDGSPTHAGVCEMLCALQARGYAVMYLTSRPLLGHCGIERTRRFLFELAIDAPSGHRMPQTAVVTTTHVNVLGALGAELSGQSQSFKANALKGVRDLFNVPLAQPTTGTACALIDAVLSPVRELAGAMSSRPAARGGLYAGFGNREKDALAYLAAGMPPERVFLIDPASRLTGRAAVVMPAAGGGPSALPTTRCWTSYTGMLESMDDVFPAQPSSGG